MIWLCLAAAVTGTPVQTMLAQERAVAQRLIDAIGKKREYQDSDFVKPLRAADKAFFARLSLCRVSYVDHSSVAHPKKRNVYVREPGSMSIGWNCKRAPRDLPRDISLTLKEGKIAAIESHLRN